MQAEQQVEVVWEEEEEEGQEEWEQGQQGGGEVMGDQWGTNGEREEGALMNSGRRGRTRRKGRRRGASSSRVSRGTWTVNGRMELGGLQSNGLQ
jgi:hypothetical protein